MRRADVGLHLDMSSLAIIGMSGKTTVVVCVAKPRLLPAPL
jgi:hypothetical protein